MRREEFKDRKWIFPFVSYTTRITDKKLPLIIQLHGAGERGNGEDDLYKVDINGFSRCVTDDESREAMIVMPQCPTDTFWVAKIESIIAFVKQLKEEFDIDEDRISLTGLSMGGFGTWFTAMAHPNLFSCIAPVSGGGMSWNAGMLTMPVWAFHGSADTVVPVLYSDVMVEKMRMLGLDIEYTRLEGKGHDIWHEVYDFCLIDWLLSHKRKG